MKSDNSKHKLLMKMKKLHQTKGIIESLRQWKYPAHFRIAKPEKYENIIGPSANNQVLKDGKHRKEQYEEEFKNLIQGIVDVATALWRIRSRLGDPAKIELPNELRNLPRHLQAAWDSLEACGIEVKDHLGEKYDPGMAVTPISYQPSREVQYDIIGETLKPTIFYKDKLIQRADVIIYGPEAKDSDSSKKKK